ETLKEPPSEAVIAWLVRHDVELALSTVTIAEIAFGMQKMRPDGRAKRLERGLSDWRRRFADRIYGLTEEAAMAFGEIMGAAVRQGRSMSAPDGMICCNCAGQWRAPCQRDLGDFATAGLDLVSPWEF